MADNPTGPANAPASGGSPNAASPAPAGGADFSKVMERLEALDKTLQTKAGQWDNLRSLHDKQMTELRQILQSGATGKTRDVEDDGSGNAAPAARPDAPRSITARELATMRDNAILKFRLENPDWQEYWADIEAIGSDQAKSRRFVRYQTDPDTGELVPDFYASLADIRDHVELQRGRAARSAADPASRQAAETKGQAKADASAIGGAPVNVPDTTSADWKKLSYDEKVRKLAEAGVFAVDPTDPPGALRG